ncbi:hypothetical protein FHR51_000933 [Xanthomonas arboricola]|nr:hypothetical protein [Xanthomonas cannabis]
MDRITTARCLALALTMLCMLACWPGLLEQSKRSAAGKATDKYIPPAWQSYNSTPRDITPFDCEQSRTQPHREMVRYRQGIENIGAPLHRIPSSHGRTWAPQRPTNWATPAWAGKG